MHHRLLTVLDACAAAGFVALIDQLLFARMRRARVAALDGEFVRLATDYQVLKRLPEKERQLILEAAFAACLPDEPCADSRALKSLLDPIPIETLYNASPETSRRDN
jgi:hypothetical protein